MQYHFVEHSRKLQPIHRNMFCEVRRHVYMLLEEQGNTPAAELDTWWKGQSNYNSLASVLISYEPTPYALS